MVKNNVDVLCLSSQFWIRNPWLTIHFVYDGLRSCSKNQCIGVQILLWQVCMQWFSMPVAFVNCLCAFTFIENYGCQWLYAVNFFLFFL
jgi:hypothetical protein